MNLLRISNVSEKPYLPAEVPDFIAFLQARLNVSHGAALTVLGDWLTHYSPKRVRTIRIMERRPSVARRSARREMSLQPV